MLDRWSELLCAEFIWGVRLPWVEECWPTSESSTTRVSKSSIIFFGVTSLFSTCTHSSTRKQTTLVWNDCFISSRHRNWLSNDSFACFTVYWGRYVKQNFRAVYVSYPFQLDWLYFCADALDIYACLSFTAAIHKFFTPLFYAYFVPLRQLPFSLSKAAIFVNGADDVLLLRPHGFLNRRIRCCPQSHPYFTLVPWNHFCELHSSPLRSSHLFDKCQSEPWPVIYFTAPWFSSSNPHPGGTITSAQQPSQRRVLKSKALRAT